MKNFEFKVRFSDTDDRQLSSEELEALAVVWEGVVENGDILTNIYPEDVCDDNKYFPVSTDWKEYEPDYSQVEKYIVPAPTQEEYVNAVLTRHFGHGMTVKEEYLHSIATWELVKFVPAHRETKSSDSSPTGWNNRFMGGGRTSYHQADVPDTWVWESSTGLTKTTTTEAPPVYRNRYDFEWYKGVVMGDYHYDYMARRKAWLDINKTN